FFFFMIHSYVVLFFFLLTQSLMRYSSGSDGVARCPGIPSNCQRINARKIGSTPEARQRGWSGLSSFSCLLLTASPTGPCCSKNRLEKNKNPNLYGALFLPLTLHLLRGFYDDSGSRGA
ncbi:hypothetical protein B0H10DRAFT_1978094, partial [Mycena sp. CBHHK59/15]